MLRTAMKQALQRLAPDALLLAAVWSLPCVLSHIPDETGWVPSLPACQIMQKGQVMHTTPACITCQIPVICTVSAAVLHVLLLLMMDRPRLSHCPAFLA
jgi:hypothetical protein